MKNKKSKKANDTDKDEKKKTDKKKKDKKDDESEETSKDDKIDDDKNKCTEVRLCFLCSIVNYILTIYTFVIRTFAIALENPKIKFQAF